ncbi:hypothetical protein J6590_002881 [Homalodisca vitripennis]|nr:hypothetical protein J6590_002881 [Homalodisca vitripennis]
MAEAFKELLNCKEPEEILEINTNTPIKTKPVNINPPTVKEVETVLKELKNYKAGGEDQMFAEVWKYHERKDAEMLNACLKTCTLLLKYYPKDVVMLLEVSRAIPDIDKVVLDHVQCAKGDYYHSNGVKTILELVELNSGKFTVLVSYLEFIYKLFELPSVFESWAALAGVQFVLRDVFPHYNQWIFADERQRIRIEWLCIQIIQCVLDVTLEEIYPPETSVMTQVEGKGKQPLTCIMPTKNLFANTALHHLLNWEPAIALIHVVSLGDQQLFSWVESFHSWDAQCCLELISSVHSALSILNKCILFKHTQHDERMLTRLEREIYKEPKETDTYRVVINVAGYVYNFLSPDVRCNSVKLLSRFADNRHQSLMACIGMEANTMRQMYLKPLYSSTESEEIKIAVLELVTECIHKQASLAEAFLNALELKECVQKKTGEESEGFVHIALAIIRKRKETPNDRAYLASVQLLHALWHERRTLVISYIRMRDNFFTNFCYPLFHITELKGQVAPAYAYILTCLGTEIYWYKDQVHSALQDSIGNLFKNDQLIRLSLYCTDQLHGVSWDESIDMEEDPTHSAVSTKILIAWKEFVYILVKSFPEKVKELEDEKIRKLKGQEVDKENGVQKTSKKQNRRETYSLRRILCIHALNALTNEIIRQGNMLAISTLAELYLLLVTTQELEKDLDRNLAALKKISSILTQLPHHYKLFSESAMFNILASCCRFFESTGFSPEDIMSSDWAMHMERIIRAVCSLLSRELGIFLTDRENERTKAILPSLLCLGIILGQEVGGQALHLWQDLVAKYHIASQLIETSAAALQKGGSIGLVYCRWSEWCSLSDKGSVTSLDMRECCLLAGTKLPLTFSKIPSTTPYTDRERKEETWILAYLKFAGATSKRERERERWLAEAQRSLLHPWFKSETYSPGRFPDPHLPSEEFLQISPFFFVEPALHQHMLRCLQLSAVGAAVIFHEKGGSIGLVYCRWSEWCSLSDKGSVTSLDMRECCLLAGTKLPLTFSKKLMSSDVRTLRIIVTMQMEELPESCLLMLELLSELVCDNNWSPRQADVLELHSVWDSLKPPIQDLFGPFPVCLEEKSLFEATNWCSVYMRALNLVTALVTHSSSNTRELGFDFLYQHEKFICDIFEFKDDSLKETALELVSAALRLLWHVIQAVVPWNWKLKTTLGRILVKVKQYVATVVDLLGDPDSLLKRRALAQNQKFPLPELKGKDMHLELQQLQSRLLGMLVESLSVLTETCPLHSDLLSADRLGLHILLGMLVESLSVLTETCPLHSDLLSAETGTAHVRNRFCVFCCRLLGMLVESLSVLTETCPLHSDLLSADKLGLPILLGMLVESLSVLTETCPLHSDLLSADRLGLPMFTAGYVLVESMSVLTETCPLHSDLLSADRLGLPMFTAGYVGGEPECADRGHVLYTVTCCQLTGWDFPCSLLGMLVESLSVLTETCPLHSDLLSADRLGLSILLGMLVESLSVLTETCPLHSDLLSADRLGLPILLGMLVESLSVLTETCPLHSDLLSADRLGLPILLGMLVESLSVLTETCPLHSDVSSADRLGLPILLGMLVESLSVLTETCPLHSDLLSADRLGLPILLGMLVESLSVLTETCPLHSDLLSADRLGLPMFRLRLLVEPRPPAETGPEYHTLVNLINLTAKRLASFLHSFTAHKRVCVGEFHEFMSRAKDITRWNIFSSESHNCERHLLVNYMNLRISPRNSGTHMGLASKSVSDDKPNDTTKDSTCVQMFGKDDIYFAAKLSTCSQTELKLVLELTVHYMISNTLLTILSDQMGFHQSIVFLRDLSTEAKTFSEYAQRLCYGKETNMLWTPEPINLGNYKPLTWGHSDRSEMEDSVSLGCALLPEADSDESLTSRRSASPSKSNEQFSKKLKLNTTRGLLSLGHFLPSGLEFDQSFEPRRKGRKNISFQQSTTDEEINPDFILFCNHILKQMFGMHGFDERSLRAGL